MSITLQIPSEYVPSSFLQSASSDIVAKILDAGEIIVCHFPTIIIDTHKIHEIQQQYEEEKNRLQQTVYQLRERINTVQKEEEINATDKYNDKLSTFEQIYKLQIDHANEKITELKKNIQTSTQQEEERFQIRIKFMKADLINLYEENMKTLQNQNMLLQQEMEITRKSFQDEKASFQQNIHLEKTMNNMSEQIKTILGSSSKKGIAGESIAEEILCELFPQTTLHDVSHETGLGDIIMEYPDGFKIMFEIKHVERLKRNDVDKFRRDAENTRCNASIMLELSDSTFPSIGNAGIEIREKNDEKKIAIFVNQAASNHALIRVAVDVAIALHKIVSMSEYNHKYEDMVDYIRKTYVSLSSNLKDLHVMEKNCRETMVCVEQSISRTEITISDLNKYMNDIGVHTETMYAPTDIIDKISNSNISIHTINMKYLKDEYRMSESKQRMFGGVKKIKDLVREKRETLVSIKSTVPSPPQSPISNLDELSDE